MHTTVYLKRFIKDLETKMFLHPRVAIQIGGDTIVSFDGMSPSEVITPEIMEKAALDVHFGSSYVSLLLEKLEEKELNAK